MLCFACAPLLGEAPFMDWDLKMPVSWDLADLEHDAVPAIAAAAAAAAPPAAASSGIAAAAASACGAPSRAECSVDLKLGGLGEFGAADRMKEPVSAGAAAAAVPSASPMKRPRSGAGGAGGGAQCPSCAVDGCKADLSKCRDYHRRHKVCEAHSKTPVVVVAGREMRFCQQCSRFAPRTSQSHAPYLFLDSFLPFKLMILFWFLAQIIQSEL